MYCSEFFGSSWWWIWPVLMIALCFFMMRMWRGTMICGYGPRSLYQRSAENQHSAIDILNRRYAAGEMDKAEYDEKRKVLDETAETKSKQL